jgi:hypothetical protein
MVIFWGFLEDIFLDLTGQSYLSFVDDHIGNLIIDKLQGRCVVNQPVVIHFEVHRGTRRRLFEKMPSLCGLASSQMLWKGMP